MPDTQKQANARASHFADRAASSNADPTGTPVIRDKLPTRGPFDDDRRLDGNAAGGVLGAIFPFEMTMAMATCAGCGTRTPLGAAMAYMHGMGTILRCLSCDTVLVRIAHLRGCYYLDLRGLQVLQIAELDDMPQ